LKDRGADEGRIALWDESGAFRICRYRPQAWSLERTAARLKKERPQRRTLRPSWIQEPGFLAGAGAGLAFVPGRETPMLIKT
jgi:hypothetical protein